jgi:LysM repeat protein
MVRPETVRVPGRAGGAPGRSAFRPDGRTAAFFRFASRPLSSLWLFGALIVTLLCVLFAPALAVRSLPLPRVSLPASVEADQELYRLLIPDEPAAKGRAPAGGPGLKSLKLSSYTLRGGEGISQAAARMRVDVGTLLSFNDIRDARSLAAGTVLDVPNGNGVKHRVRRGDSLESIARAYGVPLEGILDWNGLASSVIKVGQELFIPGAHMSPSEVNRILGNLFAFPVTGRISSRFGERADPFTGVERFHNGIDIVNRPGTPVTAAMAGTVRSVAFNSNFGRYIILSHGGGFQSMYAHLGKALASPGRQVRQGEEIGELGNTGYSTGPHLHFSIFKGGEPVDPLRYLK